MRIGVRSKGHELDRAEIRRAREKLRWALGRHAGAVSLAWVYVEAVTPPRCQVRLKTLDRDTVRVEATAATVDEAIDTAIERGAAAVARALDAARLLGR